MSQIITNAFVEYMQTCLTNQTPVVLDQFVLANVPDLDPTAPIDPDSGLPPAGQIVHRHAVDQRGRINNDAVAYTIVMDTTVGDFSFNAMYLINQATGTVAMIVHKGLETKLKTDETTGQTGNSLVKSMLMEYDRAAEATATHVDASTWQIDYAARLRGMDDDLRLQALQFFGPATFYGTGFNLVNESGVYKVQPGVAYVGGLRAQLDEVKKVVPGAKPVGLWLDIYRAGSLLDAWVNHFALTLSVPDMVDYQDSNGYQHHVAKVAIVNADGSVTDVRRKRTIELTGDVAGQGILEDAQGVTIAVEIKDGSHRHPWSELDNVPETAKRWPNYDEIGNKPSASALGAADVRCNFAAGMGISRVIGGDSKPTYPGVWQVSNCKWTPEVFGTLFVTSNMNDNSISSARDHFYHYIFIGHTSHEIHTATDVNGAWSGWIDYARRTHRHGWGDIDGKPTTMPPSAHTHTAAQANHDIVAGGWGQVGTYMLAAVKSPTAIPGLAKNIAGSHLISSGCSDYSYGGGVALPGTWKQLGNLGNTNTDDRWDDRTTLFIRVA